MAYTTHLWWLGEWFIIAIPTVAGKSIYKWMMFQPAIFDHIWVPEGGSNLPDIAVMFHKPKVADDSDDPRNPVWIRLEDRH